MRKFLLLFFIPCIMGCGKNNDLTSHIKGHLIEETTKESLYNVKVTLFDDSKIYAIVFSDDNGMFSMSTPVMQENHDYYLSFFWSSEYPAKTITLSNIPKILDLNDFVVYNTTNPYGYAKYSYGGSTYMIHKTLNGLYTFYDAKNACKILRDGYDDWIVPPADLMDVIADDDVLAKEIAEEGWYWSSWTYNGGNSIDYYYGINIWDNAEGSTTNPNEKLKVLPVRIIKATL